MKIIVPILILVISIASCTAVSKRQIKKDIPHQETGTLEAPIVSNKPETESEQQNCLCYDGIGSAKGDTPIIISDFSNGKSLLVCGFHDKEVRGSGLIMSEFNIFDCETGEPLVGYGAVQVCRIEASTNRIVIEELKYLPAGVDWSWELVQIGEQNISLENGAVVVSEQIPKFQDVELDISIQEQFLDSVIRGSGIGDNWEDEIAKLEFLSLNGNTKAWQILKSYEEYKGGQTDGALAEQWKSAIANIEWIKSK